MPEPDTQARQVHHVRRAVEVPKALAAAAVLAVTTRIALDGVPDWEADLFEVGNGLSGWLEPLLWAPMQLGSLFGPAFVALGSWVALAALAADGRGDRRRSGRLAARQGRRRTRSGEGARST